MLHLRVSEVYMNIKKRGKVKKITEENRQLRIKVAYLERVVENKNKKISSFGL